MSKKTALGQFEDETRGVYVLAGLILAGIAFFKWIKKQ